MTHTLDMKNVFNYFRKKAVSIAVVFFLSVVLCLGDGQQQQIDFIVSMLLCVTALFVSVYYTPKRALPRIQQILAGFIFLFVLGSLFWSDDAGSTMFSLIRFIDAFLVYALFYMYSDVKTPGAVIHGLLVFGLIAMIGSIIVAASFALSQRMPLDYMIKFSYGHHPLITLLLFLYPMAFFLWIQTKKTVYVVLAALFLLGSALTLSRAGVGIEFVFTCATLFFARQKKYIRRVYIGFAGILGAFCVLLFVFPYVQTTPLMHGLFSEQKAQAITASRSEYMHQAITAFLERPMTGSGLGTFHIESMRLFQKDFSSLPHNILLEHLSDLGTVGTIFLWAFIAAVFGSLFSHTVQHQEKSIWYTGWSGAACVALFSMVDIPFLYILTPLIFWGIVGVLGGSTDKQQTRVKHRSALYVSIGILLVFSLVSVASVLPFRVQYVATYLQNNPEHKNLVLFFHKKNYRVLLQLAQMEHTAGNIALAGERYRAAVSQKPFSIEVYTPYFRFLMRTQQLDFLGRELKRLSFYMLPQSLHQTIEAVEFADAKYYPIYEQIFSQEPGQVYYAIYYLMGVSVMNTYPEQTEKLWLLASDGSPDDGHFQVEYASLLHYTFHDAARARQRLIDCQKHAYAAQECREAMINGLLPPGSLAPFIKRVQ